MQSTLVFLTSVRLTRHICTSSVCMDKAAKFMNKILQKSIPKKSRHHAKESVPETWAPFSSPQEKTISPHVVRRMTVLNKVFMKYITDLMATGEISQEVLNRGIEVSHIEITRDFKLINVFWIDNDAEQKHDVPTEEVLKQCAPKLRHELSQLRVISLVPPIQFVKNKHAGVVKEVEKRLSQIRLEMNLDPMLYPVDPAQNNESGQEEDEYSVPLPLMRNDIFGLDHSRIMSKIKSSLSTSRKMLQQRENDAALGTSDFALPDSEQTTKSLPDTERQQLFSEFLLQQRIERRRRDKEKGKRSQQELVQLEEESDTEESFEEYEDIEDDYYEEDEDYTDDIRDER